MNWVIFNGEIMERSGAKVDVEDRGYQFGDGVYEVIRVYNGEMFALQGHLDRLVRSVKSIGITLPYSNEQLTGMFQELIKRNNLQLGTIYLQVTRGVAPRTHAFPSGNITPNLVAYTKELERPANHLKTGVNAILVEDIRWLRCDIKSLNLLGNVLAKQKAVESGCYEAIQHREETVTEGSSSNIFIVKNGVVITHHSNQYILKGITKDVILGLCKENGIPVEERAFTLQELKQADEVFLSSTSSEVMPVIQVNDIRFHDGHPGPVTKKIQSLFLTEIERQCGNLNKTM